LAAYEIEQQSAGSLWANGRQMILIS